MTTRLGIVGIPEDRDEIVADCQILGVEPIFLPALDKEFGAALSAIQSLSLSAIWAASCDVQPLVAELCQILALPCIPCLDREGQSALPIDGATVYTSAQLESLHDMPLMELPIPAWIRPVCTGGDSSCMRIEHPNDLSLASAKLKKRNNSGLVRVQPVVDGPVYRLLAFKTGSTLAAAGLVAEEVTSSVYRVPLGMSMPVREPAKLISEVELWLTQVNALLPEGWGYLELEFIDSASGLCLIDVQCPAPIDPHLRHLTKLSTGGDLRLASITCALGRSPELVATRANGVAMTWLLARSGVVTGFAGVEEARQMPGIDEVNIIAEEGDILSHVVDLPSRQRGGYIVATGNTIEEARERLEFARARVWINTSPALA